MRRVFQLTALVVLALWLPTTVHCSLETMFGWQAERCCGDHQEDQSAPVDHCAVEEGGYRVTESSIVVAAPDVLVCWCGHAIALLLSTEPPLALAEAAESPPELAHTWQFTRRAAWPARAPSVVS